MHVFNKNSHIKSATRAPVKKSAAYLRHVVGATFGGALRYAVAEQWIGSNPFTKVEFPRDEGDIDNDLPSFSFVRIDALSDAAESVSKRGTDGVLLDMLANSGSRIGEATALKIKDLDFEQKRARVHRTWTTDREGRRKLGPVKTWESTVSARSRKAATEKTLPSSLCTAPRLTVATGTIASG